GHERHRQAKLGRAEIDRREEGHLHRVQCPSVVPNGARARTLWDALRTCEYTLCHRRQAAMGLINGRCHAGRSFEGLGPTLQGKSWARSVTVNAYRVICGMGTSKAKTTS